MEKSWAHDYTSEENIAAILDWHLEIKCFVFSIGTHSAIFAKQFLHKTFTKMQ